MRRLAFITTLVALLFPGTAAAFSTSLRVFSPLEDRPGGIFRTGDPHFVIANGFYPDAVCGKAAFTLTDSTGHKFHLGDAHPDFGQWGQGVIKRQVGTIPTNAAYGRGVVDSNQTCTGLGHVRGYANVRIINPNEPLPVVTSRGATDTVTGRVSIFSFRVSRYAQISVDVQYEFTPGDWRTIDVAENARLLSDAGAYDVRWTADAGGTVPQGHYRYVLTSRAPTVGDGATVTQDFRVYANTRSAAASRVAATPNMSSNLGWVLSRPHIHLVAWDSNNRAPTIGAVNVAPDRLRESMATTGYLNGAATFATPVSWDSNNWDAHHPGLQVLSLIGFVKAMATTGYLNGAAQYGAGTPNYVDYHSSSSLCGPRRPGATVSSARVVAWITCEVLTPGTHIPYPGARAPVSNDLYVVMIPTGTKISDNLTIPKVKILGHTFGPFVLYTGEGCKTYDAYHAFSFGGTSFFTYAVVLAQCDPTMALFTQWIRFRWPAGSTTRFRFRRRRSSDCARAKPATSARRLARCRRARPRRAATCSSLTGRTRQRRASPASKVELAAAPDASAGPASRLCSPRLSRPASGMARSRLCL